MSGNQIASDHEVLLAKVESAYGTDPTPTEGVDVRGDITTSADRTIVERARVWAKQSGQPHAVFDEKISYSFTVAIGGVEDADDGVPGIHPFLIGAGFAVTTSGTAAGNDVEAAYAFTTSGKGSYTMYRYLYDRTSGQVVRLKMLGCRNNIEIVGALSAELLLNVTGEALYAELEPVATISAPTSYAYGRQSLRVQNVTHTLGGTARRITNWNFATNWDISPENSITGTSNAHEIALMRSGRPGGSFDPIALSTDFAATSSLMAAKRDGTEQAHAFSTDDGDVSFAYSAPKVQQDPNTALAKDGAFMRFGAPYFCNSNGSGDDEVTLTFGMV